MNIRHFSAFILGSALAAFSLPASPQTPAPPPAKPCTAAEHAQFDFWIGEWEVHAAGQVAGSNSIAREFGGCVLVERWTGAKGLTGSSFNLYLPSRRQWHQTWVDSAGSLLQVYGEFRDGAMRLASQARDAKDPVHRITWTPNADGTVRQLWETSTDAGKTWSVAFDGLYRRKDGGAAPKGAAPRITSVARASAVASRRS
jgi:hypothetical protein